MKQQSTLPLRVLIPIKGHNNKSRLSELLTEQQRLHLTQWMLKRTLDVVTSIERPKSICLIGHPKDLASQTLAQTMNVTFIQESFGDLNLALQAEVDQFIKPQPLLILFADLPLITHEVLQLFLQAAENTQADLILAPDEQENGTNVLLYRGNTSLKMTYGLNSFSNFHQQAQASNLLIEKFSHPVLAQDLDTPEDWHRLSPQLAQLGFSLEARTAPSNH